MSPQDPVNILLVDDQPAKLLTYEVILRDLGAHLVKASSGKEALAHLLKTDVAVVLVDVCMPELDGFELVSMLREHPRFEKTAVIFISAIHQTELDLLRGYETGAVDYVPVPIVPEILRAKVRVFVELYRKTRQLEQMNSELELRVSERTAELQNSMFMLRVSEERLRLASEAAEFGTYDYNVASDRLHCSPQLKRLLNCDLEGDLTLNAFVALCHPDDRVAVRHGMLSAGQDCTRRHEIEFRVPLADGRARWLLDRGASLSVTGARDAAVSRVMGTVVDITDRKQAEERQLLLMAELDHRVKNVLANVIAMTRLSSRGAGSVGSFVETLEGRIQAMARAHGLLRESSWIGADLLELARAILQPFRSSTGSNVEIRGGPLPLNPRFAQSLSLVLHELATNAVKYGALSLPGGRVVVDWRPAATSGHYTLSWRETGGPPVAEPQRRGFGLTVLDGVAAEIDAHVETDFDANGLSYSITGALEQDCHARLGRPKMTKSAAMPGAVRRPAGSSSNGKSKRVLVVEDEPLIALHLQTELERMGHQVVGPAHNLSEGLLLAREEAFDVALLDVSLGREVSAPIADQLMARDIPFAFTTGYSDGSLLPDHLRAVPSLEKPYHFDSVLKLLGQLVANASGPDAAPEVADLRIKARSAR